MLFRKIMAATLPPLFLSGILALSGCAAALDAVKSAAGLSKEPPDVYYEEAYSSQSGRAESPSEPERGGGRDESSGGYVPEPPAASPEAEVYYNDYLGLELHIPAECYGEYGWFLELYDNGALAESPGETGETAFYDWEYDEEGAYLTLLDIGFEYGPGDDYGYYTVMLDYYPDMAEEEYLAFFEDVITWEGEYEITYRGSAAIGGVEYIHYVLNDIDPEYPELSYRQEYFLRARRDMYLIQYLWYPSDADEEFVAAADRLIAEVPVFTDIAGGI